MTAKPKSELMARLRKERKEAGLVELRLWVKPETVDPIKALADRLNAGDRNFPIHYCARE